MLQGKHGGAKIGTRPTPEKNRRTQKAKPWHYVLG